MILPLANTLEVIMMMGNGEITLQKLQMHHYVFHMLYGLCMRKHNPCCLAKSHPPTTAATTRHGE